VNLKRYVKSQTSLAMREAVRLFFDEWELSRLHHRAIRRVPHFLQRPPVKLNLGCGPNAKDGWVNIDLFNDKADLRLDLREPWPFPDNSVSYIYSEHAFEHFEFHLEVPRFLGQAIRVLVPGGIFDVVVPDTEPVLKAYGDQSATYWSTSTTSTTTSARTANINTRGMRKRWHEHCSLPASVPPYDANSTPTSTRKPDALARST
jgi:predicted SAM-dependent methyltransferase